MVISKKPKGGRSTGRFEVRDNLKGRGKVGVGHLCPNSYTSLNTYFNTPFQKQF